MYIHYNQMICYICGNKTKAIVKAIVLPGLWLIS